MSNTQFQLAVNYYGTNKLEYVISDDFNNETSYICYSQKSYDLIYEEIHPHNNNYFSFFRRLK